MHLYCIELRDMDPDELLVLMELLLAIIFFLFLCYYYPHLQSKKRSTWEPTAWPVVGHLPATIANIHHLHDWFTSILAGGGYSFRGRGGLVGVPYFVTCDPSNVRHILISNFGNYPKGDEFAEIFDVLGGGIFTADGDSWRRQRTKAQTLLAAPRFRSFSARCSRDKVEKGLLPLLAHTADAGTPPYFT
ncbi:hypothetical protein ACP70R_024954 [Stipagrostis hirtigluma subsp. patula]